MRKIYELSNTRINKESSKVLISYFTINGRDYIDSDCICFSCVLNFAEINTQSRGQENQFDKILKLNSVKSLNSVSTLSATIENSRKYLGKSSVQSINILQFQHLIIHSIAMLRCFHGCFGVYKKQLSYESLHESIHEPIFVRDPMSSEVDFTDAICQRIFTHLSTSDLQRASLVNKCWYQRICSSEAFDNKVMIHLNESREGKQLYIDKSTRRCSIHPRMLQRHCNWDSETVVLNLGNVSSPDVLINMIEELHR